MTQHDVPGQLTKLGDTDLTVADPAEDVRGRKVFDRDGEELGSVDDLMVDDREFRVRFLQIGSGGFLGIGKDEVLLPVDMVTGIDDDGVHVDQTREHVAGSPNYDPDLAQNNDYWTDLYGYYGYMPYWGVGYAAPTYPFYPTSAPR